MFELNGDLDLDEDFLEGVFQSENESSKKKEAETEERFSTVYDAGQSSKKRNDDNFDNKEVKKYKESRCKNVCLPTMERKTSKELARFDSTDDLKMTQDMFSSDKEIEVCQNIVAREIAPVVIPQHLPVRQRKFPGPAGLLPERDEMLNKSVLPALATVASSSEEPVGSQSASSVFESSLWLQMTSDFGLKDKCSSLNQFNIKWVKKRAAARQLLDQKVPFLALVLHDMDCSSPDPCFTLRDASGEIHGTLHREVWEQYGGQLLPGSVLVLRQVGVLSTGLSARRHYLNVTSNNILSIYSDTRNTVVQKISHSELLSSLSKCQAHPVTPDKTPQTLYSTVGSSALRERTNLSPMLNMSPRLPAHQFVKRVNPSSDTQTCSSVSPRLPAHQFVKRVNPSSDTQTCSSVSPRLPAHQFVKRVNPSSDTQTCSSVSPRLPAHQFVKRVNPSSDTQTCSSVSPRLPAHQFVKRVNPSSDMQTCSSVSPRLPAHQFVKRVNPSSDTQTCSSVSPRLPAHQFVKRVNPSSDTQTCSSLNTDLLSAVPRQSTSVANFDFQQVEVIKQITSPLVFKGGFTPKVPRFGNLSKMSAVNASPSSPIPNSMTYPNPSTPVPNLKNSSTAVSNPRNCSTPIPNSRTPISNSNSALRNFHTPILNSKLSTPDAGTTSKQHVSCSVFQQQDVDVLEGLDASCLFDDF